MSIKYNFGCGNNKIEGCINVDIEESCKPDVVMNFLEPLPIESDTADTIYFFHVIEHIPAARHRGLLTEFRRILKPDGRLLISYPEFRIIAQNWIDNYRGMREFWKNTIYGLQRYPSDYHVSLMNSDDFKVVLEEVGFTDITMLPEPIENFNTIVKCVKGKAMPTYEEVLRMEVFGA